MSATVAAVLEPVGTGRVALESVDVRARLGGLLSETEVTQTYRNLENDNIEAVYTFPLPLDAVLLDLELTLNGRTLRGVVQAKTQAEARYEDAIDDGDSAVLLQAAGPGLFTLNVGNLIPRETAVVRFRYAQLHRWQGDSLRLHLPTTIAPRYGDPAAAGLGPHQVPEHALTADHGFSLSVLLEGAHAVANVESPSHAVAISDIDAGREIGLRGGAALMDRDFILVLRETGSVAEGLWSPDEDGVVALASFHPRFPEDSPNGSRCVALVVDCSGSMGGDSIAQARAALEEILALLDPKDRFNLIAFGSTHRALFSEPAPADKRNIRKAVRFVDRLDADMGGTEIGAALEAAYHEVAADVLLITDGAVWNDSGVVGRAKRSGQRVFTVGVGSSVAEAFVRELAEQTGGACELVSPREDMAERIVRHFRRMDQPLASAVSVEWPGGARRQFPETLDGVYGGDTVHVLAWLPNPPADHATLRLTLEDGRALHEQAAFTTSNPEHEALDVLPRVAAHRRLRGLSGEEAMELAVRYQLVTELTSCVLVHEREDGEKAEKVPALRKVPQVLAAGWGGTGSVSANDSPWVSHSASCAPAPEYLSSDDHADLDFRRAEPSTGVHAMPDESVDYAGIPEFLRSSSREDESEAQSTEFRSASVDLDRVVAALNSRFPDNRAAELDIHSFASLLALGIEAQIIGRLLGLADHETPEEEVVHAVLAVIAASPEGKRLSRNARRLIRRASRGIPLSRSLRVDVSERLRCGRRRGLLSRLFGI